MSSNAQAAIPALETAPGILAKERTIAGPEFNRWLVPPAALCIHLCIGMAYGFSVFCLPLSKAIGITNPVACPAGTSGSPPSTTPTPPTTATGRRAGSTRHPARCVGTSRWCGSRPRTGAASGTTPSHTTVAEASTGSPSTRFTGWRPPPTVGATAVTTILFGAAVTMRAFLVPRSDGPESLPVPGTDVRGVFTCRS